MSDSSAQLWKTLSSPRRLLLIAHGLRDTEMPLTADLNPEHFAYRTLVEELCDFLDGDTDEIDACRIGVRACCWAW